MPALHGYGYHLELWDPSNRTRLAYLDSIDQGSVRVSERLNGPHTIVFELSHDDPSVSVIPLRGLIKLVDDQFTASTIIRSYVSATNQFYLDSNEGMGVGEFMWAQATSTPHATKITSIPTDSTLQVHVSRTLANSSEYIGAPFYHAQHELFRIKRKEEIRDDNGVPKVQVYAESFLMDMADVPFRESGRIDVSYSHQQQIGRVVQTEATAGELMTDIFTSFDANSFASGNTDITKHRDISFSRDTPLSALRKTASVFGGDVVANPDYSVDLAFFRGVESFLRVEYRSNMHAIRKTTDVSTLATVVYPIGAPSAWEDTGTRTQFSVTAANTNTHRKDKFYATSGQNPDNFRYGDAVSFWHSPALSNPTSVDNDSRTVYDTGQSWENNQFLGTSVLITNGPGVGEFKEIAANDENSFEIVGRWRVPPTTASQYLVALENPQITEILGFSLAQTMATGGTHNTLIDTFANWETNVYEDGSVEILSGAGVGQFTKANSNSNTVAYLSSSFSPPPDATSEYLLKAQPSKSSEIHLSTLSTTPADGDYLFLALTEEPLIIGKHPDFRYQYFAAGSVSGTDLSTLNTLTALFSSVHDVNAYETQLNSQGIPQFRGFSTQIESTVDGNNFLTRGPFPVTLDDPSQLEAASIKHSTAVSSWGEITRMYYRPDIHSPGQLVDEAFKLLGKISRPRVEYQVRFGDLEQADRERFAGYKVEVGNLFDIVDDQIATSGETLASGNVFVAATNAGSYTTISVTPAPSYFDDQWRGKRVVVGGVRRAIFTNSQTQLITEGFSAVPQVGSALAIQDALRIVQKDWNPFDPDALHVEVTNHDE